MLEVSLIGSYTRRYSQSPIHAFLEYATESNLGKRRSALQIARADFPRIVLQDQDCFSTAEQTNILLELLGNKEVEARLRKRWTESSKTSEEKWEDVRRELSQASSSGGKENVSVRLLIVIRCQQLMCMCILSFSAPVPCHRRHFASIHISAPRRRSLEAPKPLAESSFLCASGYGPSVRAR